MIGKWKEEKFIFHHNKYCFTRLQKIRIFNESEELYIWKSGDIFKGRHRKDGDEAGVEMNIIEANQVLFGTEIKERFENGFIKISENRGTELILPDNNFILDDKKNRIAIKTRNYIDFENSIATYIDTRFVKFEQLGR